MKNRKTILLVRMLMLTVVAATCSMLAFAQLKNESKQIPEGKWVLEQESIHIFKGCNHGPSDEAMHAHELKELTIADVDIELYTELQVVQNSIRLISSNSSIQGKYVYDDMGGIRFDSSAIPFSSGGNVINNKLYVQQQVVNPLDESDITYVSLVYELKN